MKKIIICMLLISASAFAQKGSAPSSVTETQCQDFDKVCQEMKSHYSKHYTEPHKTGAVSKKSKKVANYTAS